MKYPLSIEQTMQGLITLTVVWALGFCVHALLRSVPDTSISRMESRFDKHAHQEVLLQQLKYNLEQTRHPAPLLAPGEVAALRNIFSPYQQKVQWEAVVCTECGTENPGNVLICFNCGAILLNENLDSDGDGMPDYWELKYGFDPQDPSDAHEDANRDGITNLEHFQRGTDPRAPPGAESGFLPFTLLKAFRKPIQIQLMGYLVLPEGHYEVQVNWAGVTEFYRIGDEIRGYVIKDFQKVIQETVSPTGVVIYEDKSYIACQRKRFDPKIFRKGDIMTENEVFGRVQIAESGKTMEVFLGAEIEDASSGRVYRVEDITLTPPTLVVQDRDGREFTLRQVGS